MKTDDCFLAITVSDQDAWWSTSKCSRRRFRGAPFGDSWRRNRRVRGWTPSTYFGSKKETKFRLHFKSLYISLNFHWSPWAKMRTNEINYIFRRTEFISLARWLQIRSSGFGTLNLFSPIFSVPPLGSWNERFFKLPTRHLGTNFIVSVISFVLNGRCHNLPSALKKLHSLQNNYYVNYNIRVYSYLIIATQIS